MRYRSDRHWRRQGGTMACSLRFRYAEVMSKGNHGGDAVLPEMLDIDLSLVLAGHSVES